MTTETPTPTPAAAPVVQTQLPADKFDANLTFVRPDPAPTRVPLDRLAVLPGFNTRLKDADYAERVNGIEASILAHGFYEDKPFSVVMLPDDPIVYIFDGEHRFDAARAASLNGAEFPEGLPVAFAKDGATVRDLTVHLVHGNAGANLNPVEMAAVVRRLKALGMNKDEIAAAIGKTTRHVDNLLVLAGSSQQVKKAVAAGQIAAAEAVKLVRKDPKVAGEKIAEAVKAAEARGKAKATPKTMRESAPTPMRTIRFEHSADAGTVVGDLLKTVAKQVRGEIKIGDGDKLTEGFTLSLAVSVVDHEALAARTKRAEEAEARRIEREKAAAERAEAAKKRAAEKAEAKKKADAEKAAKKKAADKAKADAAKAAAKAKADRAAAAKKAADAKTAAAAKAKAGTQGPKSAEQAKANARAHLGTDKQAETPASKAAAGKAASGGKTAGAAQKPAGADSGAKGTQAAPKAASAAGGASGAAEDANRGL